MALSPGDTAPDFTLFDSDRQPFHLSEADKPVVVLFFPGAFSSVCTTELHEVGNDYARYTDLGAEVVGISTDSPFTLAEFKKVHGFPFRLLSDHDGEVAAAYGAKYDNDFTEMKLSRVAKRSAFVVGGGNEVLHAEVLENAGRMPDFESVVATLEEA